MINRAGSILHLAQALDAEIRQLLDLSKLDSGKDLSPATAFNVDYAADYVIRASEPKSRREIDEMFMRAKPRVVP